MLLPRRSACWTSKVGSYDGENLANDWHDDHMSLHPSLCLPCSWVKSQCIHPLLNPFSKRRLEKKRAELAARHMWGTKPFSCLSASTTHKCWLLSPKEEQGIDRRHGRSLIRGSFFFLQSEFKRFKNPRKTVRYKNVYFWERSYSSTCISTLKNELWWNQPSNIVSLNEYLFMRYRNNYLISCYSIAPLLQLLSDFYGCVDSGWTG